MMDENDSFVFAYYEASELRRRYDYYENWGNVVPGNGRVAIDFGETLPGEKELSEEVDMFEKIKGIEDALGIETDVEKLSIRTYFKPPPKPSFLDRLLLR